MAEFEFEPLAIRTLSGQALPPAATFATPTPAWLIIERRFVRVIPVPLVKEEVEATVLQVRPRRHVSAPRWTARLPQVGGSGEGARGMWAAAEAEKPEEAGAKGSVDQSAVPAVSTVGATMLAALAPQRKQAPTQKEITER